MTSYRNLKAPQNAGLLDKRNENMDNLTIIKNLDLDTQQKINRTRKNIQDMCQKFGDLLGEKYEPWKYEVTFGYFIAEYVTKLKDISSENEIDSIFLCARRLLEIFITLKYIAQTNTFSKMIDYCQRDRYDYLEGCNALPSADEKFFPELKGLDNYESENTKEQTEILKQYGNKKPDKMPDMKKMAISIGYEEEYNYFYKFTSKTLHFCPFSLNGDVNFEHIVHKVVFLVRIAKYLEEIEKELENIYQSIPK